VTFVPRDDGLVQGEKLGPLQCNHPVRRGVVLRDGLPTMRKLRVLIVVLLPLWLVARSGRFLVVDDPQKADVIVVLAGETDRRPARALELLNQGFASRVVLDVPGDAEAYGSTYVELAQKWINSLPQAQAFSTCPIHGLSTKAEATESAECIRKVGGGSILLVTSDFHTRRALSVFGHQLPQATIHVAAAHDPAQFGTPWWRHRQWAKTNVDEWLRLVWWELIDRWL
jgi:uncharacterized SAM-binding protein YcdF (DUF218 family)